MIHSPYLHHAFVRKLAFEDVAFSKYGIDVLGDVVFLHGLVLLTAYGNDGERIGFPVRVGGKELVAFENVDDDFDEGDLVVGHSSPHVQNQRPKFGFVRLPRLLAPDRKQPLRDSDEKFLI